MSTRARLATAGVVSVALHALLMAGAWLRVPVLPPEHPPLEARLAPAPPVEETAPPPPLPLPAPPRAPAQPRRPAAEQSLPPSPPPPVIARAPAAPVPEPVVQTPSSSPETASSGESAGTQSTPSEPAGAAPAGTAPTPAAPAETTAGTPSRSLPRKGTITFALTWGTDGFSVGKAVQSWEVSAGSYKLASDAETTGLVDVFRPQRLRWLSKGTVTRQGLRPESFMVSRTRRGQTEASEAQFNWGSGSLTYGAARERATAALPGDTQDIMSFIYQLSLAPPAPGRYRLPITTGAKFDTYEIEVRPEETIETPLGTMRTLPVRQQRRPGAESIEIWLAAQYRYLPVKIRYFDRDGKPAGEQVVSDIRVSED